jgi:hypothetical protein
VKAWLLDINLLIALFWPSHSQHAPALNWFARNRSRKWATCPMTQAGFVRIISNPAFSRDAVTPREAIALLEANLQAPDHEFWPDDTPYPVAMASLDNRLVGHQQVTDAYLLALAIRRGGVLATFDSAVATLLEPRSPSLKSLEVLRHQP